MEIDPGRGVTSRAAIAGHPIHPMIIPFPIAFLSGALLTDFVYAVNGDAFWARASFWLIAAGVASGALAAVFGLIDFIGIERVRRHRAGWIHLIGNVAVMALSIVSLLLRWGEPAAAVLPTGLVLSALVGGTLVVTGWYGGELCYRHKVGVIESQ